MIPRFDLLGDLPAPGSTVVLEASAGTGKTFALAAMVTRYLAEGKATLDDMLLITFSRSATQELRERVRAQIVDAVAALDGTPRGEQNELIEHLLSGTEAERRDRHTRLRDALAGFDAATIATTHQFCSLVLKSLGVAGDTDAGVELVEDLSDLVAEIVDDIYLRQFGNEPEDPAITHKAALELAKEVVGKAGTRLMPTEPDDGSLAAVKVSFAQDVLAELAVRKRRLGVLHYDDLLSRLADALEPADSAARERMRRRWRIVMVDEFQDTDPVQWQVVDRAFRGHSTLILIGDPKQAIYAFRGGDIQAYLEAAATAGEQYTLSTNWRSDAVLVDALKTVLGGAALGDPRIVVRDVAAAHHGHRLAGAPSNAPFRLRVVGRAQLNCAPNKSILIDELRGYIPQDLAGDVAALLAAGTTFSGETLSAGQIAVIVDSHDDARRCYDALLEVGIPAVYTGDTNIFTSEAATDWLALLDAFDQTHRSRLVRAAATSAFFGETVESVALQGDALTDRVAESLRVWADYTRERGVAAVFEAANIGGMSQRVLRTRNGERLMTDLSHVAQLLQDTAHRERYGIPALRDWLRDRRAEGRRAERNRRLDSDTAGVQVLTVWAAKGLQYPVVYLPFLFNRYLQDPKLPSYHDESGRRCLHIGGQGSEGFVDAVRSARIEETQELLRLTYVALTRAQSQVVAWWAPSKYETNSGLSRLLRGRDPDDPAVVLDACRPGISDADALAVFGAWQQRGGPTVERAAVRSAPALPAPEKRENLGVRHFHRDIDFSWRRTSYSALVRDAEFTGVGSEPESIGKDDETEDLAGGEPRAEPVEGADMVSPMAEMPRGAAFGSLVHAVLETADPQVADLCAELAERIREHEAWWPVDVSAAELAHSLLPLHDTSLGPLADGLTLRQIPKRNRLCELDFEIPLAGGDLVSSDIVDIRLADVGHLLRDHLAEDDPVLQYADRLVGPGLGAQSLRGYLSGSIDAVLRVGDADLGHRYIVVDYKTNLLGEPGHPSTAADYAPDRLTRAMLHSDYPLQALLYTVVLHRFLRWRVPHYDAAAHLGGVLYLFVRGMCGPQTPSVGGVPAGVFSWSPPAGLVTALSDLLDRGEPAR